MKSKPNSQQKRKLTSLPSQKKQNLQAAEAPEFLTPEEKELYQLLENDQAWLDRKVARLKAIPKYAHLKEQQLEEMALSMFRFAALLYELATSG